jgi:hypothetical protein
MGSIIGIALDGVAMDWDPVNDHFRVISNTGRTSGSPPSPVR